MATFSAGIPLYLRKPIAINGNAPNMHTQDNVSLDKNWLQENQIKDLIGKTPAVLSTDKYRFKQALSENEQYTLIYSVNVFLNPYIVKYFSRKGVRLNEENYALSQLLQWIWRSAIRNNEEINIYIPSSRMRLLLKAYLNKETD